MHWATEKKDIHVEQVQIIEHAHYIHVVLLRSKFLLICPSSQPVDLINV